MDRIQAILVIALAAACGAGVHDNAKPDPDSHTNPQPAVTAVSPSSAAAGAPLTVTLTGSNFAPGATAVLNGASTLQTTFIDGSHLLVQLGCADMSGLAPDLFPTVKLSVTNPAPAAAPSAGSVELSVTPRTASVFGVASLSVIGALGDGNRAFVSAGGRFVAMSSPEDLTSTPLGNPSPEIEFATVGVFLRDTCMAAPADCETSTVAISSVASLAEGISPDGRFVIFEAGNLPFSDNIYVRDTCTGAPAGCVPATVQAAVASDGGQQDGSSFSGSMSSDGRFVAFASTSTNLVPGPAGGRDVYLRETCLGAGADCVPSTIRISAGTGGKASNGDSSSGSGSMSASGRYVVFGSVATNLVAGGTNGANNAFVRDTCLGAPAGCVPSTQNISIGENGLPQGGQTGSVAISADGRYVAMEVVIPDGTPNGTGMVLMRDTCAGAAGDCVPRTFRISPANSNASGLYSISADARFVALSAKGSFDSCQTSGQDQAYVTDTCIGAPSGCVSSTVSPVMASSGSGANYTFEGIIGASMSPDGSVLVFERASNGLLNQSGRYPVMMAHTGF
jgi:hypothetical protein